MLTRSNEYYNKENEVFNFKNFVSFAFECELDYDIVIQVRSHDYNEL
jgi:hypothetical protein